MLKVVDNLVYFTIPSQISQGTVNTGNLQSFTTTPQTVPVGFIMSMVPQISEADTVCAQRAADDLARSASFVRTRTRASPFRT